MNGDDEYSWIREPEDPAWKKWLYGTLTLVVILALNLVLYLFIQGWRATFSSKYVLVDRIHYEWLDDQVRYDENCERSEGWIHVRDLQWEDCEEMCEQDLDERVRYAKGCSEKCIDSIYDY